MSEFTHNLICLPVSLTIGILMNKYLIDSGLTSMYSISPLTTNLDLAKWLGKEVRYKRELLTPEFVQANGTICIDTIFTIKETQKNYKGTEVLRGYALPIDTFGRCLNPNDVEII